MIQRGLAGSPSIVAAFLEHEAPVGPRGAQFVPQRALGRLVGLGDEVRRALAADLEVLDLAEVAAQAAAGLARGALHHADQSGNCSQLTFLSVEARRGPSAAATLISPQPHENSKFCPSPETE